MKRNLFVTVVAAIAAGFCLSAASPAADCKEISMVKCTKDAPADEDAPENCSRCRQKTCKSGCNGDQSNADDQVKSQRKSAAQKVVEGN